MRLRRLRRLGIPDSAASAANVPTSPHTEQPTQTGSPDGGKTESSKVLAIIPSKFFNFCQLIVHITECNLMVNFFI